MLTVLGGAVDSLSIDGEEVDESNYNADWTSLTIKSEFIATLDPGETEFVLACGELTATFTLTIEEE